MISIEPMHSVCAKSMFLRDFAYLLCCSLFLVTSIRKIGPSNGCGPVYSRQFIPLDQFIWTSLFPFLFVVTSIRKIGPSNGCGPVYSGQFIPHWTSLLQQADSEKGFYSKKLRQSQKWQAGEAKPAPERIWENLLKCTQSLEFSRLTNVFWRGFGSIPGLCVQLEIVTQNPLIWHAKCRISANWSRKSLVPKVG